MAHTVLIHYPNIYCTSLADGEYFPCWILLVMEWMGQTSYLKHGAIPTFRANCILTLHPAIQIM